MTPPIKLIANCMPVCDSRNSMGSQPPSKRSPGDEQAISREQGGLRHGDSSKSISRIDGANAEYGSVGLLRQPAAWQGLSASVASLIVTCDFESLTIVTKSASELARYPREIERYACLRATCFGRTGRRGRERSSARFKPDYWSCSAWPAGR